VLSVDGESNNSGLQEVVTNPMQNKKESLILSFLINLVWQDVQNSSRVHIPKLEARIPQLGQLFAEEVPLGPQ